MPAPVCDGSQAGGWRDWLDLTLDRWVGCIDGQMDGQPDIANAF